MVTKAEEEIINSLKQIDRGIRYNNYLKALEDLYNAEKITESEYESILVSVIKASNFTVPKIIK